MRMMPIGILAVLTVGLILLVALRPASADDEPVVHEPLEQAACLLPTESFQGESIEQWRDKGAEGLTDLIKQMQPSIRTYIQSKARPTFSASSEPDAELVKARADLLFIDQVAQQRDAYISGLYWYTDLAAAIKEADRTDRPILSLRMLGQLDEEYSCANSRFFRTALYADRGISQLLREKFVLHWQSVRPVPVITIDMGDGRTIKRTITGNSAHYVLDSNGRVFDCIPGLYGSGTFARVLTGSYHFVTQLADQDDAAFTKALRMYHEHQAGLLDTRWARIASAALKQAENPKAQVPNARQAGMVAQGKMFVEMPLVDAMLPKAPKPTDREADDAVWQRVAKAYAPEAKLDTMSKAMMRRKTLTAEEAAARSHMKSRVEDPLVAMVRNFENAVAMDTARNEHLLRRELCNWFVAAQGPMDFDELNQRVYAELFLTPDNDPWLGLVPADTYSALDGGGLIK